MSGSPSPLTSKWGLALVSTPVRALTAGTWKSQVGPYAASVVPRERPRRRPNITSWVKAR